MKYKKQFIVSKISDPIFEDWGYIEIGDGWGLSYCKNLHVDYGYTLDNKKVILMGTPSQTKKSLEDPFYEVTKSLSGSIKDLIKYWGGRWTIIIGNKIISDCSSLKGLFYNNHENIIASTPSLATVNCIVQFDDVIERSYYYNWMLLPNTRYKHVSKALPGQYFKLIDNNFEIEFSTPFNDDYVDLSYDEIYEKLSDVLENEILYLSKKFNINIALSGGYDSRLIYGLCSKLNINFNTYTHDFPEIKISDKKIPFRINSNNILIKPKSFNKSKLREYDEQNSFHVNDADRLFYAKGQWDSFKMNDVCLRGGILELAGLSPAHLGDRILEFSDPNIDYKLALYPLKDYRKFQINSLKEYFKFYYKNKSQISYLKRYYLDQRICGWLSYIELGLDLNDCNSIHCGNSSNAINLMVAIPQSLMTVKSFHIDYLLNNKNELLQIPFNENKIQEKFLQYFKTKLYQMFHKY